jgi:hypothetical protein
MDKNRKEIKTFKITRRITFLIYSKDLIKYIAQ